MRPGNLTVRREYYLTDADFADSICNLVSMEFTGIVLVNGKSDDSTGQIDVYPNYQKGDKGDPMTWESMTEEQRTELKDSVVKDVQNEMLSSSPISDKEYEDVLSGSL